MNDRPNPPKTLGEVLEYSLPRPEENASRELKTTYATRFANNMAMCIATGLRRHFPGILPDELGKGTESPARSVRGPKRLDVNYSTPQLGLGLGISLKSVHFRDISGARRFTHNMKRNDEELRVESSGYHARQPFAVMVAVLFLPDAACDDASGSNPSSFGSWVKYLRPLSGRETPGDDIALFERVFIGLYDPTTKLYAPADSGMAFFDVDVAPPMQGRPRGLLTYSQFLAEVKRSYDRRNHAEFEWAPDSTTRPDET